MVGLGDGPLAGKNLHESFTTYFMKEITMKFKLLASILALTVASWAQTTTPNPAAPAAQENAAPQAKAECACCAKMASGKENKSCCHHEEAGKDEKAMSCGSGEGPSDYCNGKDAKSCMKAGTGKAASCGDCCGKDHEKDCCASHNKSDKTAMNCCDQKHCSEHSPHASGGLGE